MSFARELISILNFLMTLGATSDKKAISFNNSWTSFETTSHSCVSF